MNKEWIRLFIQSNQDLLNLVPDTVALAQAITQQNPVMQETWLTDRGFVAEVVSRNGGSTVMSDSILDKFDLAATQSRSVRSVVNRLYADPMGLNFGDSFLRGWFSLMTPTLFTEAERDVLLSLASPKEVSEFEVRCAIFNDDGSLAI